MFMGWMNPLLWGMGAATIHFHFVDSHELDMQWMTLAHVARMWHMNHEYNNAIIWLQYTL